EDRTIDRTRLADGADHLALAHRIILADADLFQMGINRVKTFTMADDDDIAAAALPGDRLHLTISYTHHRPPLAGLDVDAEVFGDCVEFGMPLPAETADDGAAHRPGQTALHACELAAQNRLRARRSARRLASAGGQSRLLRLGDQGEDLLLGG